MKTKKSEVRKFYDQIGWQIEENGFYQNARYEDLRPVSREYIHNCHMRVKQFLPQSGKYILDAGSGPVQYAEYLSYSEGFEKRVCLDISIQALKEARKRIGDKGFYVVADVSKLPFKTGVFDGLVSLHTLHHLEVDDQQKAYHEFYRVMEDNAQGAVVNGWTFSSLMNRFTWLTRLMERIGRLVLKLKRKEILLESDQQVSKKVKQSKPTGTFVEKLDAAKLKAFLGAHQYRFEIRCWRSVNVHFLRTVIHRITGGKIFLRFLFWLENRFPKYFGENGQYPLVIIKK